MASNRSSALRKIMQIEDKIKKVRKSPRYKHIRRNIIVLKGNTGKRMIDVENPDEMEKTVTIRRNGEESKVYLAKYETKMREYDVLINELGKKKKSLTAELF
jgi:hypothetical protein